MTMYTELFPSSNADVVGGLELAPIAGGVRVRRLPAWTRPQISDVVGDFVGRASQVLQGAGHILDTALHPAIRHSEG